MNLISEAALIIENYIHQWRRFSLDRLSFFFFIAIFTRATLHFIDNYLFLLVPGISYNILGHKR